MPKFVIEPHFRLQEWVAEEKGYFRSEGLDYEFKEFVRASGGAHHVKGDKVGAFQSIEKGREANVTCACHWVMRSCPTAASYRWSPPRGSSHWARDKDCRRTTPRW